MADTDPVGPAVTNKRSDKKAVAPNQEGLVTEPQLEIQESSSEDKKRAKRSRKEVASPKTDPPVEEKEEVKEEPGTKGRKGKSKEEIPKEPSEKPKKGAKEQIEEEGRQSKRPKKGVKGKGDLPGESEEQLGVSSSAVTEVSQPPTAEPKGDTKTGDTAQDALLKKEQSRNKEASKTSKSPKAESRKPEDIPLEKKAEKSAENLVEKQSDKPAEKKEDEQADKPVEISGEKGEGKCVEKQAEKSEPVEEGEPLMATESQLSILKRLRETGDKARAAGVEVDQLRREIAIFAKKPYASKEDLNLIKGKQALLMQKMDEFVQITKDMENMMGLKTVSSRQLGPPGQVKFRRINEADLPKVIVCKTGNQEIPQIVICEPATKGFRVDNTSQNKKQR